jgi:hypothetical protein
LIDLADEHKRSIEKASLAAKASDILDPNQRQPSSAANARKREASPPRASATTSRNKRGGRGGGYSGRDQRDYSPEPYSSSASSNRRNDSRDRDNYRSVRQQQQDSSFRPNPISFAGYNTPSVPVGSVHDVQLIGLQDVDDSFVEHVEQRCTNANLRWKTTFMSYRDDINAKVRHFHQMGVSGVLFLERKGEKDRTVALQLFPLNSMQSQGKFV